MNFSQQLRRIRILLRLGRLLAASSACVACAAALWLLLALVDAAAALETTTRTNVTWTLAIGLLLLTLAAVAKASRVSRAAAAQHADTLLADPRRPATAGLSLSDAADSPLAGWLASRSLESCSTSLAALPAHRVIPWSLARRPLWLLLVLSVTTALLWARFPESAQTIARRILHPGTDIPPFSLFQFSISPQSPTTTYGGDLQLSAEITGTTITRQVECLVRLTRTGEVLRLPAFRETPSRFTRKLENLTEPVSVAFAVGRARSLWLPVAIRLQPEILQTTVQITPPGHTGLPASTFPLDSNEISAIEGSSVTLTLTSNRPLSGGTLTLTPPSSSSQHSASDSPAATEATLSSQASHSAAFAFTATSTASLAATVRDVLGTPSAKPLSLSLRITPDLPPAVALLSPPPVLLATPSSTIPIQARADDDFSLSKILVVRTLAGFRDRSKVVAPDVKAKSYEFTDQLDLKTLGLDPGQTVELMVEATDLNPSLLGQGGSEISRIRVIPEEEYASIIRARSTIEQFSQRFQALREAIQQARKSLETLRETTNPPARPEASAEATAKAREAHQASAEMLDRLAQDFHAFELEKRLGDTARKQAESLRSNLNELDALRPETPPDELRAAIDAMLQRLGQADPEIEELEQDADTVRDSAAILEMAAAFRQIVEAQKSVTKRIATIVEELRHGENQNTRQLPLLADTQAKNRTSLDDFQKNLRQRLDALDPAAAERIQPLVESANTFLNDLSAADPGSLMDAAARAAREGKAEEAFSQADRARAALEELLAKPGPFPEAAQGKAPSFNLPNQDVNQTLDQWLKALLAQQAKQNGGQNPGNQGEPGDPGMGQGQGGMAGDGYAIDLPVIGPERLQFQSDAASPTTGGGGQSKSQPPPPLPTHAENSTLGSSATTQPGHQSTPAQESVPESYRDAVRSFLSDPPESRP